VSAQSAYGDPLSSLISILIATASSLTLVFGLYFPRHRRVDLLIGCLVVTVGVAAITLALSRTTTLGAGFGLGLLGVLSIIRLRSSELTQQDVAYTFAALSLGVIGGISLRPWWISAALCAAILAAVFVGDHPKLFPGYRQQIVLLDRAVADEVALKAHLEALLAAKIYRLDVRKLDMVEQTTLVDVRYVPDQPSTEREVS
jgi:hypothetical protein